MVALPVSGRDVTLRYPAGEEDVLLFETPRRDMSLTVALLSRVADADGAALHCEELPITDVEVLLLELRRLLLGDIVRGEATCPAADCGARIDVSFAIGEYVRWHAPKTSRDVEPADGEGWFKLVNAPVRFRLPLASDRMAVAGKRDADRLLMGRCVDPPELPPRLLARVGRVLGLLAPSLADVVQGACAECGATVSVYFDPQEFALRELTRESAYVYDEIHLLASRYHWTEAEIMAMPRARRMQYAAKIERDEGRSA